MRQAVCAHPPRKLPSRPVRDDAALTAVMSGVLILAICLAMAATLYVLVHGFAADPPSWVVNVGAQGCTTSGQWTVARFDVISASPGISADDLVWKDASTGKSNHDPDNPLVIMAPHDTLVAGDRIHVYTQPGRTMDIACDSPNRLLLVQPATNRIIAAPPYSHERTVYALAITQEDCTSDAHGTTMGLTITRTPPGWAKNALRIDDPSTGSSTDAHGNAKLTTSGLSNPIASGDPLELSTKNNHPEQLGCTGTLQFIDTTDGTLLRELTA